MVLVLEFSEAFAKHLLRVSKIMIRLLLLLVVAFVATSSGKLRIWTPPRSSCVDYSCKTNEFKCTPCHGSCISVGRVCDGSKNCGDGSDEKGCDSCDDAHLVKCKRGNGPAGCIANASICDGNRDCADGSDEKNCTTCASHLFTCNGTYDERAKIRCIAKASICDGNRDCQDGSDERYCTPCRQFDKYRCFTVSQQCIPRAWICDGKKHCADGSDETGCTCPYHRYKCKGFTAPSWWGNDPKIRCLGWDSLCDGRRDCRYGDDETDYACFNFTFQNPLKRNKVLNNTQPAVDFERLPTEKTCRLETRWTSWHLLGLGNLFFGPRFQMGHCTGGCVAHGLPFGKQESYTTYDIFIRNLIHRRSGSKSHPDSLSCVPVGFKDLKVGLKNSQNQLLTKTKLLKNAIVTDCGCR